MNQDEVRASIKAERDSTRDPEERKLEWACKQIEHLLKQVADLEARVSVLDRPVS